MTTDRPDAGAAGRPRRRPVDERLIATGTVLDSIIEARRGRISELRARFGHLKEADLHITSANDWPGGIYNGEVQIMASKGVLINAYSLAQIFPNSTVQLDRSLSDSDTTVSVVLGKEYLQNALKSDEIKLLGADKPITAPSDCVPADKAAPSKPS